MNTTPRRPHHPGCHPICQPFAATALAVATLLTGCGSDDDAPAAPTTQEVKTSVIDGAIQNATVCLDKNNNSACDTDEPTARTAANGSATLQVPPEDVGKFTLLALVGTDAIDAVSGPVPTAYVLRTPADRTALISPLTTLVKARMDLAGGSSAAADQALQDAAGLSASLFTDFTASADTAALAAMARLVVAAKQQASTALAGAQVTAAEMDRAINQRLLDLLPSLVAAAHDDAVAKTTGSAQQAAVNGAAQGLVSQELGLTAALLPMVVGSARSVEPASTTPEAGAMLGMAHLHRRRQLVHALLRQQRGAEHARCQRPTALCGPPQARGQRCRAGLRRRPGLHAQRRVVQRHGLDGVPGGLRAPHHTA
jgi:hypothetical protein